MPDVPRNRPAHAVAKTQAPPVTVKRKRVIEIDGDEEIGEFL